MYLKEMLAGSVEHCAVNKISQDDTNKFILLCDGKQFPFVSVVEIFDGMGKTPPNVHQDAYEYFYVLNGTGKAIVDGKAVELQAGSYLIVPPGQTHEIHNTSAERLYVLTTMIPDEKFSDLITSGPKAEFDGQDRRKLLGSEG